MKIPKNLFLPQLGKKIKETRVSRGLKIREIAEKTGVSKGMVSKIENGRTVPSLPVLISIITALDIDLGDFFHDIDLVAPSDFVHIKEQDYTPFKKEKSEGFAYRHIHNQDFRGFSFSSIMLEISPEATRDFVTTDGQEYLYILEGCVDYHLGDEIIKLNKGDSLFFNGQIPHVPLNSSDEVAKMLVIYILT